MDFSKESTKDLPNHGFDKSVPTCWILEGLIMYLKSEDVEKLMTEIHELSAPNSHIMVMFSDPDIEMPYGLKPGALNELMKKHGRTLNLQTILGDENFNFGRWPKDREPSKTFGFCFYSLV